MELRIKEICQERGMSISDIAQELNMDASNLNKSLKKNPTLSTLEAVAKVLKISVAELFVKADEETEGYVNLGGSVYSIRKTHNALSIPQISEYNILSAKIAKYISNVLNEGDNSTSLMFLFKNKSLFCLSYNADCFLLTVQSNKNGLEYIVKDKVEYDNCDGTFDTEQLALDLVGYIAEPARY